MKKKIVALMLMRPELSWDMTPKLHWESEDRCWNVKGYAANLLNRDVEDLLGVNLIVKF